MMKTQRNQIFRAFCSIIAAVFTFTAIMPVSPVYAQVGPTSASFSLTSPGTMVGLSDFYVPPFIKGMIINPENPFEFDFIVDSGFSGLEGEALSKESTKLIKYFLATLTIPEDDLWVNLSPYEKDRIAPEELGQTEMGRDLLAQDYLLKQITASLMYPEDEIGEKFWEKIRQKAQDVHGTSEIPVNTFNKVWIVPDKAVVYEHGRTVIVIESHLKVMLEEDYLAMRANAESSNPQICPIQPKNQDKGPSIQTIIRETILPEIEREVNEGKNFALLRQIYHSMILATWYKKKLKTSPLNHLYSDQKKIHGVEIDDKQAKQRIYERYIAAFKKGVYNFIKEEYDSTTQEIIPRKYFSGGFAGPNKQSVVGESPTTFTPTYDQVYSYGHYELKRANVLPPTSEESMAAIDTLFESPTPEQEIFMKQIVEPLLGPFVDNVNISYGQSATKEQFISIEHQEVEPFSGQTVDFRYRIRMNGNDVSTPDIVDKDKVNEMEVPLPTEEGWAPDTVEEIQYGIKRLLIQDPLNPRFQGKIKLDPYQEKAVSANLEAFRTGNKAMDIMATATGKTVVGFETMDRYLDSLEGDSMEEKGSVLFIVNNRIILNEAEEKLHGMFPGKYTSSKVHTGEQDYSGNVIFATPTSLASGGRIEELVAEKKISMVIFDEVHHVPAPVIKGVYRRIREEDHREGWGTKYLGFTATETRPDRVSVIRLFDKNVAFEYPIRDGRKEGSLVPMMYYNVDKDINPNNIGPILPGHKMYERYMEERYSDDRFDHLVDQYQEHARALLDKRGLVLAPKVERSQALAKYFRKKGVAAVSLTATDRDNDPLRFEHSYYAWKKGEWPEDSPYKNEPVPQVVVAVDIFKEGIDVPAINIVMLWADTNSIIQFMQSIGRGLRMAPFKSHLVVLDAVGLFRKTHLLRFLGGVFYQGVKKKKKEDGQSEEGERRERELREGEEMLFASEDVTKVIDQYMDDVPGHLENRYGVYSEIPLKDLLETLDPWLAIKSGFLSQDTTARGKIKAGVKEFYKAIKEMGDRLISGQATKEEIKAFRDKFVDAFNSLYGGFVAGMSKEEIQADSGPCILIYSRLFDLFNRGRSGDEVIQQEHMIQIFPEFDPRRREILRNRAKNLYALRVHAFNKTKREMAQEFIDFYVKNNVGGVIMQNQGSFEARHELTDLARSFDDDKLADVDLDFDFIEGTYSEVDRYGPVMERSGEKKIAHAQLQEAFIELFFLHPTISESPLTKEDLNLKPDEFLRKLQHFGLSEKPLSLQQFINAIKKYAGFFGQGVIDDDRGMIEDAGRALLELIQQPKNKELMKPSTLTEHRINLLINAYNQISTAVVQLQGEDRERAHKILQHLDDMLTLSGARWVVDVEDMPGISIIARRMGDKKDRYQIDLVALPDEADQAPVQLSVKVREDNIGQPHVLIDDGYVSRLDEYFHTLDGDGKQALIDGLVDTFVHFATLYGPGVVFVIPKDGSDKYFFSSLFRRLLETTGYNVFGQVQNVGPESGQDIFYYTYSSVAESRLSFFNPQDIAHIRRIYVPDNYSIRTRLKNIYTQIYDYRYFIKPALEALGPRLEEFASEKELDEKAKDFLNEKATSFLQKDYIHPKTLQILKIMSTRTLDPNQTTPITSEQLRLANIILITGMNLWVKEHWKELGDIRSLVFRYMSMRDMAQQRGVEIPGELNQRVYYFIDLVLERYLTTSDVPSYAELEGLNELMEEIQKFSRSIADRPILAQPATTFATTSEDTSDAEASGGRIDPPFFVKHPYLDEDRFFAIWVEGRKAKPRKGKRPPKETFHWDPECHKLKEARESKGKEVKLKARIELLNQPHHLCKACGIPMFADWERFETEFAAGKYPGHEVDYKTGELIDESMAYEAKRETQKNPGGIDLNAQFLDLMTHSESSEIIFTMEELPFDDTNFQGLTPVILQSVPLPSLVPLLGLTDASDPDQLSHLSHRH